MRDDEMVCWCSSVTAGDIRQVRSNGGTTMDDIRRKTGACTLGHCRELSPRGR
jgi:NAD(P)H-nitrite reductase large subunit